MRTAIQVIFLMSIISCAKEEAIPVAADFDIEIVDNDFTIPVQVFIHNKSNGADTYHWTLEGGDPASSTKQNPGIITYNEAGFYTIKLAVSNQDGSIDSLEKTVPIDANIDIEFSTEVIESNYPPMELKINNLTEGIVTYLWTFEGGVPATSTEQHPPNVTFAEPGNHVIKLNITNGLESYQLSDTVTVAPYLVIDFDYEIDYQDQDLQVPVTLYLTDQSTSATQYLWSFPGGNPSSSTAPNPSVTYNTPGDHEFTLEVTNNKETLSMKKSISTIEDSNIRIFEDIKFGINSAHNQDKIPAFFSSYTRNSYTKSEVTDSLGQYIDIVFFGLNDGFTYNKFVSPDKAADAAFSGIPNSTHTKFINLLESCACSSSLSVSSFDDMSDDSILKTLTIEETVEGLQDFDNTMNPRIVLFETHDNRIGAIKIKQFVADGQSSYILTDIKVQKLSTK